MSEKGGKERKGTKARPASANPLVQLSLARIREFLREPEAIFWVFVFPVLLAFALGIAFRNRPAEVLEVAVEKRIPDAVELARALSDSEHIKPVLMSAKEANRKLSTGEIALSIAPFEGSAAHGSTARESGKPAYSFRFDPDRSQSRIARPAAERSLQCYHARGCRVHVRAVPVEEAGGRYIDFLIPGLIGLNLMASGMWGIGFHIVDARTKKLLKLYTAMPMRRSQFLFSYVLSRLSFLVFEVIAIAGFGFLAFDVKIHGSILSLALVLLLGAGSFGGLGLLIASRPKTVEAVSGWMNFAMLPMWILSGAFFSYKRFPEFTHPFIKLLPLTALNDATRAIMNDGYSIFTQLPELAVMAFWGLACFLVALRIFRWQ